MEMEKLDLSILEKIPEPSLNVILEIEPLAPLSMVSELPGSYYKTLKSPDKKMLCGLFENILGWHIDLADRKAIIKDLTALRRKQAKKNPQAEFVDKTKGSTYSPLLMDYFDLGLQVMPVLDFYDDLWSKAYRRADAIVHPKGTFNICYDLIPLKRGLGRNAKNPKQIDDSSLEEFFKENITRFPHYYSTPTTREYVFAKGKYEIQIVIDHELFRLLDKQLSYDNIGYIGTSEGWIELKIRKL